MNKEEAKIIIHEELNRYRSKSYDELKEIIDKPIAYEITNPNGVKYQIEIEVFWDDKKNGNIRVLGNIDDGGLSAFRPLSDDFIKSPSGEFIGE
jgi:hypothetical protein